VNRGGKLPDVFAGMIEVEDAHGPGEGEAAVPGCMVVMAAICSTRDCRICSVDWLGGFIGSKRV
jgi:hypothetical protein